MSLSLSLVKALAGSYLKKQAKDAVLFIGFALLQGYKIDDTTDLTELAKEVAEWVFEHGTPTAAKVKEELGL